MKIKIIIFFGFTIILILIGLIGLFNYSSIKNIDSKFKLLEDQTLPTTNELNNLKIISLNIYLSSTELILLNDQNSNDSQNLEKGMIIKQMLKEKKDFNESFDRYYQLVKTYFPEEMGFQKSIKEEQDLIMVVTDEIITLEVKEADNIEILEKKEILKNRIENISKIIDQALKKEDDELKTRDEFINKTISNSIIFNIILLIFGLIISLSIYFLVFESISRSIRLIKNYSEEIGKGNLDAKLEFKSKSELNELAKTFNIMSENLKKSTISNKELEEKVKDRTKNLEIKNKEQEKSIRIMNGRELEMIKLKKELEKYKKDK